MKLKITLKNKKNRITHLVNSDKTVINEKIIYFSNIQKSIILRFIGLQHTRKYR